MTDILAFFAVERGFSRLRPQYPQLGNRGRVGPSPEYKHSGANHQVL